MQGVGGLRAMLRTWASPSSSGTLVKATWTAPDSLREKAVTLSTLQGLNPRRWGSWFRWLFGSGGRVQVPILHGDLQEGNPTLLGKRKKQERGVTLPQPAAGASTPPPTQDTGGRTELTQ